MTLFRSGLVAGFALWAAATAIFVPFGRFVFGADVRVPIPASTLAIELATFAGVYALARALLAWDARTAAASGIAPQRTTARLARAAPLAVALSLPGLTLDGGLYALGGGRYPGLDAAGSGAMACGLLWAYAAALAATLAAAPRSGGPALEEPHP